MNQTELRSSGQKFDKDGLNPVVGSIIWHFHIIKGQ